MSRTVLLYGLSVASLFAVGLSGAAAEPSQPAQAAPVSAVYTTAGTNIGGLLEDSGAKAVLDKHVPQLVTNEQIAMARSMTPKQIQSLAGDVLTEDTLAKIDADLAKLRGK